MHKCHMFVEVTFWIIQGLQAHNVIFDLQITGSSNAIFSILRAFLKSVQKHNFDATI